MLASAPRWGTSAIWLTLAIFASVLSARSASVYPRF